MKNPLFLSIIISLSFLLIGLLLLYYGLIDYGISLFVFLPFILGFILGGSAIKAVSITGLAISLTIFFILLIMGGLEGMVCILMALPLVIGAVALGALVKYIIKKYREDTKADNVIKSSLFPLGLFLIFGLTEKALTKNDQKIVSVKTEIVLPYSALQVYETIKSVDTLIADKPFLMQLDLPIPNKCVLEKEEVGGLRTCYFSGGTITEKITELEKGKVMRMDVIDYTLTGAKWLGFKEAIYYFDKIGENSCKLTRITTYTSALKPRFYWERLEKLGISQEHDYVFANLKNDLKRK